MFKPKELFFSASAAATIAFSGVPKAEASVNTSSNPDSISTNQTFIKKVKDSRIVQEFLPFDPEPTFIPFEPTYPTYDPRENLKGYQARDFEFALGNVDEDAMTTNCREVFGQHSSVVNPYESDFYFKCNVPTYEAGHTRTVTFNKQILCERKAIKNYTYLALSRNLKGATLLGGFYDQSSQQCFVKINAHE